MTSVPSIPLTTNYRKYFGTSEKVAQTIDEITLYCGNGGDSMCKMCPLKGNCQNKYTILEWLKHPVADIETVTL